MEGSSVEVRISSRSGLTTVILVSGAGDFGCLLRADEEEELFCEEDEREALMAVWLVACVTEVDLLLRLEDEDEVDFFLALDEVVEVDFFFEDEDVEEDFFFDLEEETEVDEDFFCLCLAASASKGIIRSEATMRQRAALTHFLI